MAAASFQSLVREAMEREQLSLDALSRVSKIGRNSWYAWFDGRYRPTMRLLRRAAPVLKLTVEELAAPWGESNSDPGNRDGAGVAVLSRLDALVEAVSGLVSELREARLERADLLEEIGALETAAKLRGESDDGTAVARPVPHQRG